MRMHLFRWWKHWQLDMTPGRWGWFCLGVEWRPVTMGKLKHVVRRSRPRFIAYFSPDATPSNPRAKGLGAHPIKMEDRWEAR